MKVAIIIVNYNKKALLAKCLDSVYELNYKDDLEIVIVDNGSSDGSEHIFKSYPESKFIQMGYNSGFCKANNVGIAYALSNGAQGVVVLNNDTELDSDFLSRIVKKINIKKGIGMIAPRILLHGNRNIIDAAGFLITPDGLGKNLDAGKNINDGSGEMEVFCPTGAATFYAKEVLEDICMDGEYFDEDFEFCYEELDLGWRARFRGWKCLHIPGSIVYHHKSASYGAYSEFAAYYSNRNIFFNIIKNYPSCFYVSRALFLSLLRYPILLIGIMFQKGVGQKITKNIGHFRAVKVFFKSLKDACVKMPKMIKKRNYIQKRKNIDKTEIKRWFNELGLSFFDSIYNP